jgi:hypothetical protein
MTAATIVDWIEQEKPSGEPLTLSEPSKTWVDRMWHAMIDSRTTDAQFDELDVLFIDCLHRLDDDEQLQAHGMFLVLVDMLAEHGDVLPRCRRCGSILCPHCGERYRGASHEER